MASSLGVMFSETSALTNENVENTFSMMLECTWLLLFRDREAKEAGDHN